MFAVSCPTLVPGIRRFSQSLAAVTFPSIFFDTVHPGDFLSLACQRHQMMWTLEKHVRSWHVEVRRVSSIAMIWMTSRGSSATWGRTADTLSHEIPVVWKLGQLLRWALNINPVHVPQDTDTFLVLGSPAILTRKWCVGEMVTVAQLQVMAPQPGPWWGFGGGADICCERMQTRCLLILFLFCLNRFSYQSECCGQHKLGSNFHLVHTNMVCNSPMFTKKTREAIRPVEKFQHTIIIHSCSSTIIHPLEVLEVLMMWDSVHDVPPLFVLQPYVSGPRHSRIMSIPYYWHGPTSQSQMRLSSRTTPASFRTLEEL